MWRLGALIQSPSCVIYAQASLEYVIKFVNFAYGCIYLLNQIYLITLKTVVTRYHSFAMLQVAFTRDRFVVDTIYFIGI